MADAIAARIQGDDAQAVLFWQKVAELFTDSNVEAIGYEVSDVRGFDDVAVYYHEPIQDLAKSESLADFWQSKFRVTPSDAFRASSLTDPSFIGATTVSFLQRLRDAQRKHAPDGRGARFYLTAPIPFDPHDPLCEIVSNAEGHIRIADLFTGGKRSKTGKLRQQWMDHLEMESEEELKRVLLPLRIQATPALSTFREQVSLHLRVAGWKPFGDTGSSSSYDDLARKFIQTKQTRFTREELEKIGKREGLIVGQPLQEIKPSCNVGIRSFSRGTDKMADETDRHLCLLRHFDDRWPRNEDTWESEIIPAIVDFVAQLDRTSIVHLQVSGHNTVAFAAGYALDSKAGVEVYPVQVSGAHNLWDPKSGPPGPNPAWALTETVLNEQAKDVGVAISITHDLQTEVVAHVRAVIPQVGRVLSLQIAPQVGGSSVAGGAHAHKLAAEAVAAIRELLSGGDRGARIHLFAAAPSAFMFLLGQRARVLGACQLYEHDFQRERELAYHPSATFPWKSSR